MERKQNNGETHEPRWTRRPEDRPQELLEAALEVFAERGYRAARLEEVARRAGVSKGTIYLYFKSKEELLHEAVLAGLHSIESEVDRAAAIPEGTTWDRVRLTLKYGWDRWVDPQFGRLFRLIVGEAGTEHPHLFEEWAREGPLHHWGTIENLIKEGQANGEFRTDVDAKAVARVFAAGLMMQAFAQVHTRLGTMDPYDPDQLLQASLQALGATLMPNDRP